MWKNNRERMRQEDETGKTVHTLRVLPRCFPLLRCCLSTEKTHKHRATEYTNVVVTWTRREKKKVWLSRGWGCVG